MYKNPEREGVYQDHKWGIQIKNETKNGYKKVIAIGSFDLDNYISEKKKSFEIKVTLIPTNKNIRSGFIDFQLTSVMLVDGVPYGSKEEELKEYLRDAMQSLSSLKKASGTEDKDDGGCGSNGSHYDVTGSTRKQSSPQHCSLQNAEAIKPGRNSACNNREPKKPRKNPPPVPPRSKNPCPVPPAKDMNNDYVATSEKSQHSCKKQQKECKDNSVKVSSRSVQEKAKPKDKYPHKLNPFGESPDDEASSEELSNCGETPALNNVPKTDCKQNHQKQKRKTCGEFKKKTKGKYPKELNPFASSSQSSLASEESVGSRDVSSSTEVGEIAFSNQSSDEEELKKSCPSRPGKVLSSVKTSRQSASEKHGSKGRNSCTDISSAVFQIKKGQAKSKEDIKPLGVGDHSHKNSCKDENSFKDPENAKTSANRGKTDGRPTLDNAAASACVDEDSRKKGSRGEVSSPPLNFDCEKEQADSEQTEIKADNPSQGKPEEGLEIVGNRGVDVNGNVDVTNAEPSAVDERPVRLEPISAQGQEVMSESQDQAVKGDSGKMAVCTTLCCEIQTDSGVTVSDGCASDSQDNEDEQLSIETVDSRCQNTVSSLNEKLPPAKPPRVTRLTQKGTASFSKFPNFKGILPPAKPPRQSMLREKVTAGSIKLLQCHSELEAYVAEETFSLNQEIHALSNVISKVENELQKTMKFAECHEECSGLKQDWLSLNKYMDELNTRNKTLKY
ncbi:PREDICTED: uncharacterized protein LOC107358766 [Acropora digitifera]|uniref:uncharacterized protein LOC107358766 n=1 Tax=Acropora digitifera TaxID=70779 RepID=UPI00077AA1C6|nr:PREDICTED: uncharacterized protein LOC107358766 [Acropora digitifera]XP_015780834.1 PREDICTED: uncharacterized protein LOC107358766 [Acropora digitifera]XP_015780835.1 PREDICTED: uncharacterized protein LOC107358766 [Acropora digitifera]XP_015780836.1 PREDICTED: uncharacterized protein LOC107358766 [Acropora digitifera]XP_015780837.1 PREDICTED: uncharacterized protein LOC107358766 [Acropora digitifera]